MLHAFLLVILMDGTQVLEPIGAIGLDPVECAVIADWRKQLRKQEAPLAQKITAQCYFVKQ